MTDTPAATKKQKREIARELGDKLKKKLKKDKRPTSWFWEEYIESADLSDDDAISLFGFYNLIKGRDVPKKKNEVVLEIIRNFVDQE